MIDTNTIDLVIFDCDGVLVDSEPISNQVLAKHATSMGWEMDGATSISIFKGMTMDQVHCRIESELKRSLDDSWIKQYYADTFTCFKESIQPIKGVEDLIQRVVSKGIKICVASQGPPEKMKITLGTTGLWNYFEGNVFSARSVPRPKPFPDLFLYAAKQMNVDPGKCCVIEDSRAGVNAAQAAGMPVIYYCEDKSENISGNLQTAMRMDAIFLN